MQPFWRNNPKNRPRTRRVVAPQLRLLTDLPARTAGLVHSEKPTRVVTMSRCSRSPSLLQMQRREERRELPVGVRGSPDGRTHRRGGDEHHQRHGRGVLRQGQVQVRMQRVEWQGKHQEPAGVRGSSL